jgi:cytochrome c-type biogenesis protein CcmH
MKNAFVTLFAVLLIDGFTSTAFADKVNEDPIERRVLDIGQQLRCAVCQNQPVSESRSGLANDMRDLIREQLVAGKSEQEIIDYFVERYGDYVLMKPRRQGIGLPLWLIPPVLLVIIGFAAVMFLRARIQKQSSNVKSLSEEDKERVRKARDKNKKD